MHIAVKQLLLAVKTPLVSRDPLFKMGTFSKTISAECIKPQ